MSTRKNEDDDNEKTLEEKQQELLALGMAGEDDEEDAVISIGDDDDASDTDTDADKDKEKEKKVEGEDAEQKEDQRASSEAEEDAAEEERRKKERESSAQRRARQRRARELLEKKLAYYEKRNEELEKRFSNVELRQMQTERLTIDQAIKQAESQLAEAKRLEKEAITAHDGDAAVQARELADIFEARRDALARRKLQVEQTARRQAAPTMREPPPEMAAALMWIEANKSWFDPKLNNEDSVLASAIEDALVRERKLDPSTPEFWEELDNRLARRGIGKRNNSAGIEDIDDDEEDEDNDASSDGAASRANSKSAGERTDARNIKKPSGGPKVSVGGAKRVLKPGEVYVSADRIRAMKEAGIWDDPEARKQMLKRYREFDRQAAQGR